MNLKKLIVLIILINLSLETIVLSQPSIPFDAGIYHENVLSPSASILIMILIIVGFFGWTFWKAHEDKKKGK